MKPSILAAALLAFLAPAAAQAAGTVTFNGACASVATQTQAACTSTNGAYGNTATIAGANDATLGLKLSAWQANQSTGAITAAFLGAYGGGFGVTGVQDQSGGGNLHQIDNVNGYADFVMLQFSRAVHLEGVNLNLYQLTGVSGMDSDLSVYNASAVTPSVWNGAVNLAPYVNAPSAWENTSGGSAAGYRAVNATGFSQVWLISASQTTVATDRNDGFKLGQIIVSSATPAVPEPATWATMIAGFGAIGASLRRRARRANAASVIA